MSALYAEASGDRPYILVIAAFLLSILLYLFFIHSLSLFPNILNNSDIDITTSKDKLSSKITIVGWQGDINRKAENITNDTTKPQLGEKSINKKRVKNKPNTNSKPVAPDKKGSISAAPSSTIETHSIESSSEDIIFDPSLRNRVDRYTQDSSLLPQPQSIMTYTDNLGQENVVDGDRCFKVSDNGFDAGKWSGPFRCPGSQTESQKIGQDFIDSLEPYRQR
ncbi:MAG: hypothetical protein ACRBBR_01005 [Cellvibrionaceae bacterium]